MKTLTMISLFILCLLVLILTNTVMLIVGFNLLVRCIISGLIGGCFGVLVGYIEKGGID